MKVAARQHGSRIGEDQRIIGYCVRFGLDDLTDMAQYVQAGAGHLGLAADRVRVLHPVTFEM